MTLSAATEFDKDLLESVRFNADSCIGYSDAHLVVMAAGNQQRSSMVGISQCIRHDVLDGASKHGGVGPYMQTTAAHSYFKVANTGYGFEIRGDRIEQGVQ